MPDRPHLGEHRLGQLQPPLLDHDSGLSAVVLDTVGDYAPHAATDPPSAYDRGPDDSMDDCLEPAGIFTAYAACAAALDDWHAPGQPGPRPPGRLRRLSPPTSVRSRAYSPGRSTNWCTTRTDAETPAPRRPFQPRVRRSNGDIRDGLSRRS